jgi:hypothetical protein
MSNIRVLNNISLYNSITATSGVSTNTLSVASSATAGKLSIGGQALNGYNLAVGGDAYISGSLNVAGSAIFHNTQYTTTSAISVTNTGTGPALVVTQTGNEAVAAFYDAESGISLYVDGKSGTAGNVGIGTSTPSSKLTVVGDISASGRIYSSYTINKFVSTFGDTSNLNYTIIHGLGVQDVVASIVDASTQEVVYPLVTNTATNQITVGFSQAPGDNAYKAIIIG